MQMHSSSARRRGALVGAISPAISPAASSAAAISAPETHLGAKGLLAPPGSCMPTPCSGSSRKASSRRSAPIASRPPLDARAKRAECRASEWYSTSVAIICSGRRDEGIADAVSSVKSVATIGTTNPLVSRATSVANAESCACRSCERNASTRAAATRSQPDDLMNSTAVRASRRVPSRVSAPAAPAARAARACSAARRARWRSSETIINPGSIATKPT